MSGAQGALPPGSYTDTTYEMVPGAEEEAFKLHSTKDAQGVPVNFTSEKAPDPNAATGMGGPVFGAAAAAQAEAAAPGGTSEDEPIDMGISGTG